MAGVTCHPILVTPMILDPIVRPGLLQGVVVEWSVLAVRRRSLQWRQVLTLVQILTYSAEAMVVATSMEGRPWLPVSVVLLQGTSQLQTEGW